MRTSREELIRKGVLKEHDDSQQNHLPKIGEYFTLLWLNTTLGWVNVYTSVGYIYNSMG